MQHLHFYDYSYDQTFDVCATETFKSVAENEWYQTSKLLCLNKLLYYYSWL